MKKLQYQLSNGNWVDCGDRTEDFLVLCEENNGFLDGRIVPLFRASRPLTRSEVLTVLSDGKKLRNDNCDWYSNCRYEPAPVRCVPVEMVLCDCGCTVPTGSVMRASLGLSCIDCYDRLSG